MALRRIMWIQIIWYYIFLCIRMCVCVSTWKQKIGKHKKFITFASSCFQICGMNLCNIMGLLLKKKKKEHFPIIIIIVWMRWKREGKIFLILFMSTTILLVYTNISMYVVGSASKNKFHGLSCGNEKHISSLSLLSCSSSSSRKKFSLLKWKWHAMALL